MIGMETTRAAIKYVIYGLFKTIGSYNYYRNKNKDKSIVLTYHGVVPKVPQNKPNYEYRNFVTISQFERQIKFLLKKYRPLKVTDLLDNSVPGKGFLITFDDGYRNNYLYALPVLERYNLQACFFISTDLIAKRRFLWTDMVNRLIMNTRLEKIRFQNDETRVFSLNKIPKKELAAIRIRNHLKTLPPSQRDKVIKNLISEIPDVPVEMRHEEEERYLFMNWAEVDALAAANHNVGSHTHTHPILSTLTEDESYQELKISKELIEKNIDHPCEFMSYPNGEKNDFSAIQKRQLQDIGFRLAFTQISPYKHYGNDPYELNRINISLKRSMPVFEATICGFKSD